MLYIQGLHRIRYRWSITIVNISMCIQYTVCIWIWNNLQL